jgi:hypothetical protein
MAARETKKQQTEEAAGETKKQQTQEKPVHKVTAAERAAIEKYLARVKQSPR